MKSPKDVGRSLVWNYAGRLADAGGMYVVGIIVAHALGVGEYASYAIVLSAMQMVVALSTLGIEATINRFLPSYAAAGEQLTIRFVVRQALIIRCAVALIVGVILYFVLGLAVHLGILIPGLFAFTLFALMRSLVRLLAISMVAQLETRIPSAVSFGIRAIEIAGVAILGSIGSGVTGFILVLTATACMHVAALISYLRPPLFGAVNPIPLKPLVAFGAVFSINAIVDFVISRFGDVVLLGVLIPDKTQTAIYEIGAGLVQAAGLVLTTGFGGVNLALFSELALSGREKPDRMREFYHALVRVISALTLPLMVFLLIDADLVVGVLYPQGYAEAATVLRAFAGVRILARLFGGGENTDGLLALGKAGSVSGTGLVAAVVNLSGDLLLIPMYGAMGAVIATSLAYMIVSCGTYLFVRRYLGVKLQLVVYFRFLAGNVIAAFVVWLLRGVAGVPGLLIHGVVFCGGTLFFWTLTRPFRISDAETLDRMHWLLGKCSRYFSHP